MNDDSSIMKIVYFSPFFRAFLPVIAFLFVAPGCQRAENGPVNGAGGPDMARMVEVAEVEKVPLIRSVRLVGSLAANESVQVRPEMSGLVRVIGFREGQEVGAGDILVELDPQTIPAQREETEALLTLAKLEWERSERLWAERAIPRRDLDQALAEKSRLEARLNQLDVLLGQTQIRAPFDGITGARRISPGDLVNPQSVITRIDDLSALKIDFQIPERFLDSVRPGTRVRILQMGVTALENDVEGAEITFIDPEVARTTRASEARALLPEPPPVLRPGMFVNLELVLEEIPDALVVPEGALAQEGQGNFILLVEESEEGSEVIRRLRVQPGLRRDGKVQIIADEDLAEGTKVVAAGAGILPLSDGQPVQTRPARALANRDL